MHIHTCLYTQYTRMHACTSLAFWPLIRTCTRPALWPLQRVPVTTMCLLLQEGWHAEASCWCQRGHRPPGSSTLCPAGTGPCLLVLLCSLPSHEVSQPTPNQSLSLPLPWLASKFLFLLLLGPVWQPLESSPFWMSHTQPSCSLDTQDYNAHNLSDIWEAASLQGSSPATCSSNAICGKCF